MHKCPIKIPCEDHNHCSMDYREFGTKVVRAAYDQVDDIEQIEDPWRNIIARKKHYHGIRVRGDKKNTVTYGQFLEKLSENWDIVTQKCESARMFEENVRGLITL